MGLLFVASFIIKDYALVAISGILSMIVGVYLLIYHYLGIDDYLVLALGTIFIAIGFYLLIRSAIELLEGGK